MKKVLITGTSKGIGFATAKKFLDEGWFVLGTSTSNNATIKHTNYKHYLLNLSDSAGITSCANLIKKENKQIDVLINNAGVSYKPDEDKVDVPTMRKVLEVNLIGNIDFTEKILQIIKPLGHIVAVSSMMSSLANFSGGDWPAYRISKTALNMYLKTLADRLKKITVSAFDPGWVKTEMGGKEAPREPEVPARELFELVTNPRPTGNFWFEGKVRSW